jgi:hypothetical protein
MLTPSIRQDQCPKDVLLKPFAAAYYGAQRISGGYVMKNARMLLSGLLLVLSLGLSAQQTQTTTPTPPPGVQHKTPASG